MLRFLVLALLLATACAAPADRDAPLEPAAAVTVAAPEQPEGHRRMVEELRRIAEVAATENPYFGEAMMAQAREDLATLAENDIPPRWFLNMYLGKHLLRLGREREAVDHYLEANRLLELAPRNVPLEKLVQTWFETGVAHMRWGETENCVAQHTSDSCIFPIEGGGVHVNQQGARAAIGYFERVQRTAAAGSLEAIRSRWLYNIAFMAVGEYPDGVPADKLIPPETFASDESFPRFVDVAPELGLNTFDLAGGAIVEDFDGDFDLDLMVSSMHTSGQMHFYRNDGDGRFSDRTRAAGLEGLLGGLNMIQADYDNDGDVDVLVLRGAWWRQWGRHPNSLLRNNGDGTFTDVTYESGLGEVHYPTQTAGWADYDNDGDLDLYVGNESGKAIVFDDVSGNDARYPSQLFRNDGESGFTDVAAEAGVENYHYTKGVTWGDYDNDGDPDIYVSNGGFKNRLYRNDGDGGFTDVADEAGVGEPVSSFPTWFFDANNDGLLDLFVGAYGGATVPADVASIAASYLDLPHPNEMAKLYIGDGRGGFRDEAAAWGLTRVTLPMGANHGDLDNDGRADFYLGTGYPYYEGLMPNVMYRNNGGRRFSDVTTAGGFGHLQKGHAVVFADLDNDGDQDLFEQMGGAFPGDGFGNALFENPGFDASWIKLRLIGRESNRFGVGARIRVEIVEEGERRSIHHVVSSGGSFGGNPLRPEIGLGAAARIELLEVHWPTSGETQRFEQVAVKRLLEITEGEPELRERELTPMRFAR